MQNIIIGKRSNLTFNLKQEIKINKIFSSNDILSDKFFNYLKNTKEPINIIFNSFFPLFLMNNFDPKTFIEKSHLIPLVFIDNIKKGIKKNKKLKINKIILSSSASIYLLDDNSDTISDRSYYAAIKELNEKTFSNFCKNYKINLIIARIFNVYGGNDQFSIIAKLINSYKTKSKVFIRNKGSSVRDFINVKDVVLIYKKLLVSNIKGKIDIGSGNSYSLNELIKFIGRNKLNIEYDKDSQKLLNDVSIANISLLKKLKINFQYDILSFLENELKINGNKIINYYGRGRQNTILLSPPAISSLEVNSVQNAMQSNWIAPVGPDINRFEMYLSQKMNNYGTVALNSGTSALHLALKLLNIKQNDFIICQSFTFAGSVFPIIYEKAIPIFVDSDPISWNIDPILLEKTIIDLKKKNIKPKAIIVVDLYGMPANYWLLNKISKKYKIPLIEDAAEALGSKFNNKSCGTFGKFGVLSFNGNKIITTGGGGALVSNNKSFIKKAKFLSQQSREKKIYYEHKYIGYNYRLSNISASIGFGQIQKLESFINKRRDTFEIYKNFFLDYDFVNFQKDFKNKKYKSYSNRWLSTFNFNIKNSNKFINYLIKSMTNNNIEVRPLWKPMHLQPVFKKNKIYSNGVSAKLFESGICLPSGTYLNDNDLDKILTILKKCLKKI